MDRVKADSSSRTHLGSRVRITRQYAYGPHSVVGELQGIAHHQETTELNVNVLGENLHLVVEPDDQLEVLEPGH